MSVLEFIFRVLVIIVLFILGIGTICMKWDTKKLEEENARLKVSLQKARRNKLKREYKKVSDIGGDK